MTYMSIIYLDVSIWMLVDGGSQKPMASTSPPIPRHCSILKRSMCEKVIWRPKMVLLCFGVFSSYGFVAKGCLPEPSTLVFVMENCSVHRELRHWYIFLGGFHQPKLQFVGPRWVEKGLYLSHHLKQSWFWPRYFRRKLRVASAFGVGTANVGPNVFAEDCPGQKDWWSVNQC